MSIIWRDPNTRRTIRGKRTVVEHVEDMVHFAKYAGLSEETAHRKQQRELEQLYKEQNREPKVPKPPEPVKYKKPTYKRNYSILPEW